jgi:hypothetical protein
VVTLNGIQIIFEPSETKLNPAATHTSKQNVVSPSPALSVNLLWAGSTQIVAKVKKNEWGESFDDCELFVPGPR